ncbi:MAG: hypothetical protein WC969_01940 [Elusimicrobiota bacterium]|jgi:hypothetical protein
MNAALAVVFAALAAASMPSSAGEKAMTQSPAAKAYECKPPADWTRKPGSDGGERFSKGRLSISVTRYGPGTAYRRPEDFLAFLATMKKAEPAGTVEVSGKKVERLARSYERSLGGDDALPRKDWVYEEVVLLRLKDGFWALRFQSTSRMYPEKPKGLPEWEAFLKVFRLR